MGGTVAISNTYVTTGGDHSPAVAATKQGTLLTPDQAKALIQYVHEHPNPPPYKLSILGSLFGEFRRIPTGLTKKLYEFHNGITTFFTTPGICSERIALFYGETLGADAALRCIGALDALPTAAVMVNSIDRGGNVVCLVLGRSP